MQVQNSVIGELGVTALAYPLIEILLNNLKFATLACFGENWTNHNTAASSQILRYYCSSHNTVASAEEMKQKEKFVSGW